MGDRDQAAELVAGDLRLARAFGAAHAIGAALRAAGLIEGGSRGIEQLTQAVDVLDGSGVNLELGRTLADLGAAAARGWQLAEVRAAIASELRVAHMAAQGLTNRQIAEALVSMKTVSCHLGHVYAKLHLTDRAQLAAALPAQLA